MKTVAILLCAGAGHRMGDSVDDKALARLGNRPLFDHSLQAFEKLRQTDGYLVVYRDPGQRRQLEDRTARLTERPVISVAGGRERWESVYNALQALPEETEYVFIHDCARPLIHPDQLKELYRTVVEDNASCLAHRMVNTVKQTTGGSSGTRRLTLKNLDRSTLWEMETPQAFAAGLIRHCYREAIKTGLQPTDDMAAVIHCGHRVTLVENPRPNPKITFPQDLSLAELLLEKSRNPSPERP